MRRKPRVDKIINKTATALIEKLSHDGRAIARIDGKTTFIQGALAGEQVLFEYVRKKRDYDEGRLLEVLEASPYRVPAKCPHYEVCGGCSLQHLSPTQQIIEKEQQLLDLLQRVGHCEPEVVLAPISADHWHYRNKARLSVRYVEKKQATLIGFRERVNPRYITEINQCPILNQKVSESIPALRQLLDSFEVPSSIAQIEVAAGDDDVALIFRNLEELSEGDSTKLQVFAKQYHFRIYLQPAGPDSVFLLYPQEAEAYLHYALPEWHVGFQFHPTDFTQVNARLNEKMIAQALFLLDLTPDDIVLDLFCGLGNFSLPMAKHCLKVIGVEGSAHMVARASDNAALNQIVNTAFFSANLDDDAAITGLKSYGCHKLLLDPPRTGALTIVKHIDQIAPQRIVYVSCNPATLARDSDILVNQHGYRLLSAGVMDMFPHTAHVESIALFEKG